MTRDYDKIIDALAADLTPVRKPLPPLLLALLWWAASWIVVVGIALALGPLRPGALDQLVAVPQFTLESATGLIAGLLFSLAAFRLSIPGLSNRSLMPVASILLGGWVLAYVIGFAHPALETGMTGKREHCAIETLLYSIPALLAAAWLFNSRYTIRSARAGLLIGIAAAAMPALFMQLACMYEPEHILRYHLAPMLPVAILGMLVFRYVLRRRL